MRPSDRMRRLGALEAQAKEALRPIRAPMPLSDPAAQLFFAEFTEAELAALADAKELPAGLWTEAHHEAAAHFQTRQAALIGRVQVLLAAGEIELTEAPLVPCVFAHDYAHADLLRWFDHWLAFACQHAKLPWPADLGQLAAYLEGALCADASETA